jgi:hypothetical protein
MSSTALAGVFKTVAAVRGQQVVGLLLTTIPLAERMLLYHVAMTAWLMLPERGLLAVLYPAKNPGCPISRSFFARCGIPQSSTDHFQLRGSTES